MHSRHIFFNRPSVFENFQILWFSWQSLKSYDKFMAFFKFPILYDKFRNLLDVGALILKKVIWGNKKYSEYRGEKKVLIKLPGVYRFNKNTQLRNLFLQSKLRGGDQAIFIFRVYWLVSCVTPLFYIQFTSKRS